MQLKVIFIQDKCVQVNKMTLIQYDKKTILTLILQASWSITARGNTDVIYKSFFSS